MVSVKRMVHPKHKYSLIIYLPSCYPQCLWHNFFR